MVIACATSHDYLHKIVGNDYYFEQFAEAYASDNSFEQDQQNAQEWPGEESHVDQLFIANLYDHIAKQLFSSRI